MEVHTPVMDHPKKRRRRRRLDRIPLSATLISDPNLKGDEGVLTPHLYHQLFPLSNPRERRTSEQELQYIAVSPWAPQTPDVYQDRSWTILPVGMSKPTDEDEGVAPACIVRLPALSSTWRSLFGIITSQSSIRSNLGANDRARILVLDVEPVKLTIVYVRVDGNSLERHEQIQKEFGGGFGAFRKDSQSKTGKGKAKETLRDKTNGVPRDSIKKQQEKELKAAVRSALGSFSIVRQGDLLPIPLPAHPITHVPLPPAEIILCESVNQGLLTADTQIVVDRHFSSGRTGLEVPNRQPWSPQQPAMENGEETSNEQFFSAMEDRVTGHTSSEEAEASASDSGSPGKNSDGESDESTDNIISLTAPGLPTQSVGTMSAVVGTPKARRGLVNGTSTPDSVFSGFTATTARQGSDAGKAFQACSLLAPLPDDLVHPKPSDSEDDESRVYVDVRDLMRLRCFSGDWVKVRASVHYRNGKAKDWSSDTFRGNDKDDDSQDYRVVKVYGIPDVSPRLSLRHQGIDRLSSHRRSSVATFPDPQRPVPKAWLSPLLLANLDHPNEVRLASLTFDDSSKRPFSPKNGPAKLNRSRHPPIAAEVSLAKISTPISQEVAMQESLFLKLKHFFESKRRIARAGDLIALAIDVNVGRIFGSSNSATDKGKDAEELLALIQNSRRPDSQSLDVVWFKVGQIAETVPGKQLEDHEGNPWGGAFSIEPTTTRMTMGTSHQCRIPSGSQSSWKSYLGLARRSPAARLADPLSFYMSQQPQPYVSTLQRRLRELIAAAASPRAVHLGLEPTLILLHSNQRNVGKATVVTRAASDLGLHTFSIDAYDVISEGSAGEVQESSINTRMARGLSCGAQFTSFLIRHLEALTSNRMIAALQKAAKSVRVLVATTNQLDQLPENLRSLFTHEVEMSAPDESEREGILRGIIEDQGLRIAHDVDLAAVAVKTAALVAGNLVDIVERASIARQERLENLINTAVSGNQPQILVRDLVVAGGEWARCITKADFDLAVDAARKNFADAIGAPKIPNVSWDDVGGLENVKDAVMETIQLPLERPELFARGMKKRSGILFYGPPGTGKTLLAKAIATEFSLNFFSVKGPELLNMYIGESEANVRRVFQRARDARPCVVFFDELDSVAPKRGNQGDSGGVMDRIVSQLLAELDGMSDGEDGGGGGGVFVIGATNRPDLLDQALLRPGRFDKMLYLGISDTHQKQLTILEALTRKFTLHPELSLARVAESLPFTYTGADLYALCSDAMLKAITRQASVVDTRIKALPNGPVSHAYFFDHLATKEDIAVTVTEEDFLAARRELVGSVSAKELEHYQRVRRSFETPAKPSSSTTLHPPNATIPPSNHTNGVPHQQPLPTTIRPKPTKRTNTAIFKSPTTQLDSKATSKDKGKGKAPTRADENEGDDDDDDDDEAYTTSNDFVEKETPEKGKGKQRATMIPKPVYTSTFGFGDGSVSGEEDMYR
ncbi:MAG: hypothetical protein Q9179_001646 [Wetmoreana sp. 5 TL-2023]